LSADWGEALKIGLGGFAITILVLAILALIAWGIGAIVRRTATKQGEEGGAEKQLGPNNTPELTGPGEAEASRK